MVKKRHSVIEMVRHLVRCLETMKHSEIEMVRLTERVKENLQAPHSSNLF